MIFKSARGLGGLKQQLRDRGYQPGAGERATGSLKLYDTFDWRLFKNHLLLGHELDGKSTLSLFDVADAKLLSLDNIDSAPRFSHEIKPADINACLTPIIKERALIDMGHFTVRREGWGISDKHGKILAKLYVERLTKTPASAERTGNTVHVVKLQSLKGYERETKKIFSLVTRYCDRLGPVENPLSYYFSALGRTPGDYSSKLLAQLDRDMTIQQAMSTLLLFLLDVMERNTAGIRDDIDSEFLHDFRIANRRSRSLVSGIKHVLPAQALELGKGHFSWLSKQTSLLRDTDVFLLAFQQYEQLLPGRRFKKLLPLRELLQQQKKAAHADFLEALDSNRHHEFVHDWREFLQENHLRNKQERGMRPVIAVADDAIWKAWKRLQKHGRIAQDTGADQALHEMRKSGKKLRYLLEAFRTLFPADDMEEAIGQLRKIQNILGDIVDYQVQQQFLQNWQKNFSSAQHKDTNAAMSHLYKIYSKRETAAKNSFQRNYEAFISAGNRKLFKSLFRETAK